MRARGKGFVQEKSYTSLAYWGWPIKSHALISPNSLDIFGFSKKDYQLLVDSMIALVHVFENLLEK